MAPTSTPDPDSITTPAILRTPRLIERGPELLRATTHRLLDQLRAEQQDRAEQAAEPGTQTVWLRPDLDTAADRGDIYYTAEHPRGLFLALSTRAWWETALPAEAPEAKDAILTALRRHYLLAGAVPLAACLAIVYLLVVPLLAGGPTLVALVLAAVNAVIVLLLGWANSPASAAAVQMRYPYDHLRRTRGAAASTSGDEVADYVLWPFRSSTSRPVNVPAEATEATSTTVLDPTWPAYPHHPRTGLTMVFIPGATTADIIDHPQPIGQILTHLLELHRADSARRTSRSLPTVVATQAQIQRIHDRLTDPAQLDYQTTRHQH